jgi:hypothetical protein
MQNYKKKMKSSEKVLKIVLNSILLITTGFVVVCADNPDVTIFFLPACIYLVVGFLRVNAKEFHEYLTTKR